MEKSAIYSKTGDDGTTGLVGGSRISKGSFRVDLYGTVDELNANVGMMVSMMEGNKHYAYVKAFLLETQRELFNLGSHLACDSKEIRASLPKVSSAITKTLEEKIDSMDRELPKLEGFILYGGTTLAVQANISRAICRRLERKMIRAVEGNHLEIDEEIKMFVNRFSDYLFMLGRYINKLAGRSDTYWKAKNR